MVKDYYLISDAAKLVDVESHVLRYWEEELKLPIKRNELGHRYYTTKDVERFKEIKELKEQGLQLKAIRLFLKDGKLERISTEEMVEKADEQLPDLADKPLNPEENKAEKARRLQWLLQQMIAETLHENNQELCKEIKESVIKELDYQFRIREQREDARELARGQREDEYYQKLDELLRMRSKKKNSNKDEDKAKRKRHSFF